MIRPHSKGKQKEKIRGDLTQDQEKTGERIKKTETHCVRRR